MILYLQPSAGLCFATPSNFLVYGLQPVCMPLSANSCSDRLTDLIVVQTDLFMLQAGLLNLMTSQFAPGLAVPLVTTPTALSRLVTEGPHLGAWKSSHLQTYPLDLR